jgi:hypothetical protein
MSLRSGIPHAHIDLPPLQSVEATAVSLEIGNNEVLLAAAYKPPGKPWSDGDIIHLVNLTNKFLLAGDLNTKNPTWRSHASNPRGEKLLWFN